MWSALVRVGQMLGLAQADPTVDLEAIASVLDSEDGGDEEEEDEQECEVPQGDGIVCQQRTGVIVALFDKHGTVKNYRKDADGGNANLHFNRKDGPPGLKVGHQVTFLIYKGSEDDDWVVRKILSVENFWDADGTVVEEEIAKSADTVECETAFKNVIAKMTGRDGRTILASQFNFSLDSVKIDFIPVEGDWLVLQSLMSSEREAERDTVLQVDRVWPLRARYVDGRVSHCAADGRQGILDSEALFTCDACEPGYRPRIGDRVRAYCIESEQGGLMWRALRLVAIDPRPSDDAQDTAQPSAEMLSNKRGIVISEDTDFGHVNMGQDAKIEVARNRHKLQNLIGG